jgi:hypothetical protein
VLEGVKSAATEETKHEIDDEFDVHNSPAHPVTETITDTLTATFNTSSA